MDHDVAILLKLEELDIKFRALKDAVINDCDVNFRIQLFEQAMAQLKGILTTYKS